MVEYCRGWLEYHSWKPSISEKPLTFLYYTLEKQLESTTATNPWAA